MSCVTRPTSILRKLVPFKFDCCGPVAEVARSIFERHPHLFPYMLATLQSMDTAAEPRIEFADALQQLMDPRVAQGQLRKAFEKAEASARREFFMSYYDKSRAEEDFNYRLDNIQLVGATSFWSRMFRIDAEPIVDAIGVISHLYAADVRRDPCMNSLVTNLVTQSTRDALRADPKKIKFVEDCLILERDIFGAFRFDKFANRVHVFHSISEDVLGETDETYGLISDIDAMTTHGHFTIDERPSYDGRWRQIRITCRPEEEESAPWRDYVHSETIGRRIAVDFDEPIVGRPPTVDSRIRVDGTLHPTTTSIDLELATFREDETWLGRLWRKRHERNQETRPQNVPTPVSVFGQLK